MTTEKEIELKLENMDTKINSLEASTIRMEQYILQLITAEKESRKDQIKTEKENTEKLIAAERRNTNIFVGIIVIIVVIGGIKYLFHL